MRNEQITKILDKSRKYSKGVDITFRQSDKITSLLDHIALELNQLHEELIQLHTKRERQEIAVFKIGFEKGYVAALRDLKSKKLDTGISS